MDIQPDDSKTWFSGFLSVISLLLGWIWVRVIRQHDQHSDKIQKLERTCVTRDELHAYLNASREDRRLMHEENREMLQRIHDRVDDLYRNRER